MTAPEQLFSRISATSFFAVSTILDSETARPGLFTGVIPNSFQKRTKALSFGSLKQRIYAIAAGYEDCNDAARLSNDGMQKLALGFLPKSEHKLASQPTLSRWENSVDEVALKSLQKLLVHTYIRRFKKAPQVIKLAMDTTCDKVYGYQQLSFYNGFYEEYCFTPLFIFDDDGFPLGFAASRQCRSSGIRHKNGTRGRSRASPEVAESAD